MMEIGPTVSEDCPAIARAQVRSWQAAYEGILTDEYLAGLSVEKRATMWREFILRGSPELLVARDGSSVVGFVAFGGGRVLQEIRYVVDLQLEIPGGAPAREAPPT